MTDHTTSVDSVFGVIGAGPVGENVADRVTHAGLSAAIIKQDLALTGANQDSLIRCVEPFCHSAGRRC
jgi:hypothetical protein